MIDNNNKKTSKSNLFKAKLDSINNFNIYLKIFKSIKSLHC